MEAGPWVLRANDLLLTIMCTHNGTGLQIKMRDMLLSLEMDKKKTTCLGDGLLLHDDELIVVPSPFQRFNYCGDARL